MWDLCFSSLLSTVCMIMIDFPPNPEDGELWLPSDVYQEIESLVDAEFVSPKSNASTHHATKGDEMSVGGPFGRIGLNDPKGEKAKSPKNKENKGSGRTRLDGYIWPWAQLFNTNNYHYNGTAQIGNKQPGGTGVFLPQHRRRSSMEAEVKSVIGTVRACAGTGVFLNQKPPPPAHKRTKSCGVNMQTNVTNNKVKCGIIGGNIAGKGKKAAGGKQPPAVKSDWAIHLPDDWIY